MRYVKITLKIRKIMDEKKLTPYDIKPFMNISVPTMYKTINAKRLPNLKDPVYFSLALGVPVEELYTVEIIEEDEE